MHRHRLDPLSLVFGIIFAGTGIAALAGTVPIDALQVRWLVPVLVFGLGLWLVATSRGARSDR